MFDRAQVIRAAIAVALVAVFVARPSRAIELLDVPLDHWAYEFLERFEVRAGLDRTGLDTRPLTRGTVAALTWRLLESAQAGGWTPTPLEQQQLDMLRDEFSEELVAQGHDVDVLQRAYHRWGGDAWGLQIFFAARQLTDHALVDPAQDLPQLDARFIFEPAIALELGEHFVAFDQVSYRVRTSDGQFENSTNPLDGEAEFVHDEGDRFSITRAVYPSLRYGRGPVLLDLGRERLRWGPGRSNAMLIADAPPPLDQIRLHLDFSWLHFTSVTGQLRPAQFAGDPVLDERYIAAHRLTLQVHRRFLLAISEATVYGERGLDLSYINPLSVLFVTQANNGDLDNALASLDGKILLPNLELYGELVLDDLNLRRGLSHYGNKLATVVGLLWLQPFGARDWDVDAEWSWASQYTYTHHMPQNRWEHYGSTLGSRTGTDADLWVLGVRRRLTRGWDARLFYELERHGEGSVEIDQEQRSEETQEFLSGTVEERHQPGLAVRYRGLRNVEFGFDYRYAMVKAPDHDAARERVDTHTVHLVTRLEF